MSARSPEAEVGPDEAARAGGEHLLIFARAPVVGRVKTRLFPVLSPTAAAHLYGAFVIDVVDRHRAPDRQVTLFQAEPGPSWLWQFFAQAVPELGFAVQRGADLGARMAAALRAALAADPEGRVVLIGADSPTLPPAVVDAAFEALEDHTLVLGPALDGGYYLVGVRGAVPPIFEGPQWGSAAVLAQTLDLAAAAGLRPALTEFWYDVDRPEDLAWLARHLPLLPEDEVPQATARWVARQAALVDAAEDEAGPEADQALAPEPEAGAASGSGPEPKAEPES